ncbi:MAG: hypothetical protein IPJ74_24615 [Saprospiraceae bacterium]|nr:hypothetical protein [Saprospiraceae bacterium]
MGDGFEVLELVVEKESAAANKLIKELNKEKILPPDTRIMIVKRNSKIIIPEGETRIFVKDIVVVLSKREKVSEVSKIFGNV